MIVGAGQYPGRCTSGRRTASPLLFLFVVAWFVCCALPSFSETAKPQVYLWAWERREELKQLPADVGVAFLAGTVRLVGRKVITRPRRQPLLVDPKTPLISVCRIEIPFGSHPDLTEETARSVADAAIKLAHPGPCNEFQIDFDALSDQRDFYKRVLTLVRQNLSNEKKLSITALLSWCLFEHWLANLPVDDCVPMFFSMGRDHHNVLTHFSLNRGYGEEKCSHSIGISVDEPEVNDVIVPRLRSHIERAFVFSKHAWTAASIDKAVSLLKSTRP